MITSSAKDGQFETDIGGPTYREPWRDLVMLDGSWFQFPEGYQCGFQRAWTIRKLVKRDRQRAAQRWSGEKLRPVRALHATLVGEPTAR